MQNILNLFRHIFGNNYEFGLNWFCYLLKEPNEKLPVIILSSQYNNAGKSTFVKFMKAAFADSSVIVHRDELMSNINDNWCDKDLVLCEEADINNPTFISKIKKLATSNYIIKYNEGAGALDVKCNAHFILTTNAPISAELPHPDMSFELRSWLITVPPIPPEQLNPFIYGELEAELPAFFDYIEARAAELCIGTPQS